MRTWKPRQAIYDECQQDTQRQRLTARCTPIVGVACARTSQHESELVYRRQQDGNDSGDNHAATPDRLHQRGPNQ